MTFTLKIAVLILLMGLSPVALSDPAAIKKARETWGTVAMIGTERDTIQSVWTKKVGYKSPGCVDEFTVVGKGPNTWDAAFTDADLHPAMVHGPYRGMLTITKNASDNVAVASVTLVIDGVKLPEIAAPSNLSPVMVANFQVDTATLANGFHVVCAQAVDLFGNIGQSYNGYLFKTDQTVGLPNATWIVPYSGTKFQ